MDRDTIITTIMVAMVMFTAIWWVAVNVPEFFTTAVIYMLAMLMYVPLVITEKVPAIPITTENLSKQIFMAFMFSLIIILPSMIRIGFIVPMSLSPISMFFIVAVAPVVEEMFFRGLIFPMVSYRTNMIVGILVTSMIFALFHYSVYGIQLGAFMWLLLLSIINCFLVAYTGSLIPAIMLHMVNNAVAVSNFVTLGTINVGLVMLALTPLVLVFRRITKILPIISIALIGIGVLSAMAMSTPMIIIDTLLYHELAGLVFISLIVSSILILLVYYMVKHDIEVNNIIIVAIAVILLSSIALYSIIGSITILLIITIIPAVIILSQYNK